MTILFAGGELDAFLPSDSSIIESISQVAGPRFNPMFARCGISCGADSSGSANAAVSYARTASWPAQAQGYLHFDLFMSSPSVYPGTMLSLCDAADVAVVRIRAERLDGGTHTLTFQYWDGAAYVVAGAITIPAGSLQTFDFHWNLSASGTLVLFISGTDRFTFSGDLSHLGGIIYARLHRLSNFTVWSQVIADTEPTIGHRLYTLPPAGPGANTAWTGGATEIDEPVTSDTDFINTSAPDQVESVTVSAPSLTGYVVQSVTVSARAKTDGSGPANLQLALRVSSADYFSASKPLEVGYAPYQHTWVTNPATAGEWGNAAIAAVQPGVKSIA